MYSFTYPEKEHNQWQWKIVDNLIWYNFVKKQRSCSEPLGLIIIKHKAFILSSFFPQKLSKFKCKNVKRLFLYLYNNPLELVVQFFFLFGHFIKLWTLGLHGECSKRHIFSLHIFVSAGYSKFNATVKKNCTSNFKRMFQFSNPL